MNSLQYIETWVNNLQGHGAFMILRMSPNIFRFNFIYLINVCVRLPKNLSCPNILQFSSNGRKWLKFQPCLILASFRKLTDKTSLTFTMPPVCHRNWIDIYFLLLHSFFEIIKKQKEQFLIMGQGSSLLFNLD